MTFSKNSFRNTIRVSKFMVWIQIRTDILSFLIWDQTAEIMQFKVFSRQNSKERVNIQAHNQAEARKHGLQHHIGLDARNHYYADCEEQRHRPAWHPGSLISAFVIGYLKSKVTRSDVS